MPKLTYANFVSSLCLFLVLAGGTAVAASQLGKSSVGTRQLRKNAVTGAKVKDHSLTGTDIALGKLGTVPAADQATTAGHASTADSATAAGVAAALTPIEPTHLVGMPGEPVFQSNSRNVSVPELSPDPVGFYKDHEGIVHLQGLGEFGTGAGGSAILFTLPPGFRPTAGTTQLLEAEGGIVLIGGTGSSFEGADVGGEIVGPEGGRIVLDGVTFRAGS